MGSDHPGPEAGEWACPTATGEGVGFRWAEGGWACPTATGAALTTGRVHQRHPGTSARRALCRWTVRARCPEVDRTPTVEASASRAAPRPAGVKRARPDLRRCLSGAATSEPPPGPAPPDGEAWGSGAGGSREQVVRLRRAGW